MAWTDNLISHWKLDEASGSRADSHGSNTLTDNNTVTQAVGKLGNAAQFTAANLEYLSRADNAGLSTGDIDFTIVAWVYADSFGAVRDIVTKHNATGNQREYRLRYDSTANRFQILVSSDGVSYATLSADTLGAPSTATWYLLIAWHDSVNNTLNISVNGGATDSVSYSSGVRDGTGPFNIGAVNGATTFDGRIDSVSFWKRVITSDERTALYNDGNGREYPFTLARSQSADGGITPDGSFFKLVLKTFAGTLSLVGTVIRAVSKVLAGIIAPSGNINTGVTKSFSGDLSPGGSTTKQTGKSPEGTILSEGGIVLNTIKSLIGVLTGSGDVVFGIGKSLAGNITPIGDINKQTNKSPEGMITPGGGTAQTIVKSLVGILLSSGAISREIGKNVSGEFQPTGSISKLISKVLSGELAFSGALDALRTFLISIGGSLMLSGDISKSTGKLSSGGMLLAGGIGKAVATSVAGTIEFSGNALKNISAFFSGAVGLSGSLIASIMQLAIMSLERSSFRRIFGRIFGRVN